MLPKRRRLTATLVQEAIAQGVRSRQGHISIKYLANKGPFGAAVVVRKALVRSAVGRNRIRRAVYRALSGLPSPKGGKIVVFVERVPEGQLSPAFAADLARLLAPYI